MKFFLIDDDPDTLALVSRLLTDAGHEVVVRASSTGAMRDIPEARPDCVITDLMMPVMDGFELTRELRRRTELSGMKILILSVKSYDFDRRRAKEMGADGYLTKPINRETFLQSIDEIVSNRISVNYWGVHGTLPVPGQAYTRYGGNTPCISVEIGGEPLYIFDCGSGIKRLSDRVMANAGQRFSWRIFISHTHWDHINTVPFFAPLYARGNQIELFGPYQGDLTIERAISAQMESVYFPVTIREFGARIVFRDLREERLDFGPVRVETILLRHPGYCLGYKLSCRGRSVCYITDNELYLPTDPRHDARYVQNLADFVRGADVLITDTTYRDHEYPSKVD
ncbi:MAG: response regulator [Betaproteobacteria bacterium]|nr:response regulator [Betaproteobacteria bacterium]